MTTFTMRYVNDNFVVAAPMSRRCSSSRALKPGTGATRIIPVRP